MQATSFQRIKRLANGSTWKSQPCNWRGRKFSRLPLNSIRVGNTTTLWPLFKMWLGMWQILELMSWKSWSPWISSQNFQKQSSKKQKAFQTSLVRKIWRDVWTFEMKSSLPLMVPMPRTWMMRFTLSAWKAEIMNLEFTLRMSHIMWPKVLPWTRKLLTERPLSMWQIELFLCYQSDFPMGFVP